MSEKLISDEDLKHIADLLMGAAHADGRYEHKEADAIKDVLKDLVQEEVLPHDLYAYLDEFEADTFDLKSTCEALQLDAPAKRRFMLKLIARVTEGDEIHDLDETTYIKRAAAAMGASPEDYKDLTVEFTSGADEGSTPPPIPED